MSNGWHTGIAISTADIDVKILPEVLDFPTSRYLEFGWGDVAFYQADAPDLMTTLEAALAPTDAVMHINAMPHVPEIYYREAEVIILQLSEQQILNLLQQIATSFQRDKRTKIAPIAAGRYANSYFYPAVGQFHIFNTCNSWVAETLAAAGIEIDTRGVISAEDVMRQLRNGAAAKDRIKLNR